MLDEATEQIDREVLTAVGQVADQLGCARAQVALRWLMSKPEVTAPILGVTKLQHLEDALATVDLELTDDHVAQLEAPYRPRAWHIYA